MDRTFERLYHDALAEIESLRSDLAEARAQALRHETEAHALRREIQNLRMNADTERIHRVRH